MGCFFSSCPNSSENLDSSVRVIHVNGYVQDFTSPITAVQVTGSPSKHVLCTSAQLLSASGPHSRIRPGDLLEPGRVYFMLPHSMFQSDASPMDLATLASRLSGIAKRTKGREEAKVGLLDNGSGLELGSGMGPKLVWSKVGTWKPALETILEMSFRRRESIVGSGSMRDSQDQEETKRPLCG